MDLDKKECQLVEIPLESLSLDEITRIIFWGRVKESFYRRHTSGCRRRTHKAASSHCCKGKRHDRTAQIGEGMDINRMRAPVVLDFLRNNHLLDAVARLIGAEITCCHSAPT